jgi:DNA-directed RNA polymerase subunit L
MFSNYTESGTPLLTDPSRKTTGTFVLENTTSTIANTLRRCTLMNTRSAGFRADLTDATNPGVVVRKNTSVIVNEMLAHRLTLLPLGVVDIDGFDPTRYECVLRAKNERKGPISDASILHVTAADFVVRERAAEGEGFVDVPAPVSAAMFPKDPITGQASLLVSLRPQYNAEQPAEEVDLTAYPIVGTGTDHMGLCPVSQCSFQNTLDENPVRQDEFFADWVATYKKVADVKTLPPEEQAKFRQEWTTLAIQRCFKVDDTGQPNSFTFTVESVGMRPVPDIVAEGIRAVIDLVTPYTSEGTPSAELGIHMEPPENRMKGVNVVFGEQEHTLGNLLQTLITEMYLDAGAPDSPITFCGYRVRHPLRKEMTLTLGIRDSEVGDSGVLARKIIADAATKAREIFVELGKGWEALVSGRAGAGGEAGLIVDG